MALNVLLLILLLLDFICQRRGRNRQDFNKREAENVLWGPEKTEQGSAGWYLS